MNISFLMQAVSSSELFLSPTLKNNELLHCNGNPWICIEARSLNIHRLLAPVAKSMLCFLTVNDTSF